MRPELNVSVESLAPYLSIVSDKLAGLSQVEKFATGQSNPTYRIACNGGEFVLRAKPSGQLLKGAHQVEREYRAMLALAQTNVPVPKVLHLATDEESPFGRAFFVMEFLEGRIFWDPALPGCENTERIDIYTAMNSVLASLHSVDPTEVGLADFGKPGDYFARQLDRWGRNYEAAKRHENADMDRLKVWLFENLPPDDGQTALVHGDFRLDNMIFAPDRAEVIGLLDWELSTLGHPFADIAYQCMQWSLPHEGGMQGLGGLDRASLGIPGNAAYLRQYCALRGVEPPKDWTFYLAFSFFRLAAILEGVVRRAVDGNASNPESGKTYEAAIPLLATRAVALIEGRTL